MVFPIIRLTFQVRKAICGGCVVGGCVACRIIVSAPVPFTFPFDFGFKIWDLDLGLDLGLTNIEFALNSNLFLSYSAERMFFFG